MPARRHRHSMAARWPYRWGWRAYAIGGTPMTIVDTTARMLSAPLSLPRLLAVLALVAALVAIPAISPGDASARRTSEKAAQRACAFLGGDVYYEFPDQDVMTVYSMSCQT